MPSAVTYTQIATVTLTTSGISNVAFTNLGTAHTDLVVKTSLFSSGTGSVFLRINNDAHARYGTRGLYGNGTNPVSLSSFSSTKGYIQNGAPTTYSSSNTIHIMNYNTENYNKIIMVRGGHSVETGLIGFTYQNGYKINSLLFEPDASQTFSAGTTISIYGIAMA